MSTAVDVHNRPLKRQKLGIPDVYPQYHKQEEDDLCEANVKRGFVYKTSVSSEYASAKDTAFQVHLSKYVNQFNKILYQKQKVNTLQDNKKRVQVNVKETFWHVTAKSKAQVTKWMQELASNKPLSQLAKKIPFFNKREEIPSHLAANNVSLYRATWFLKMTNAAYQSSIAESKTKKRQNFDSHSEWTYTLIRFLKEQLGKLSEYYGQPYTSLAQRPPIEKETATTYWNYGVQLTECMIRQMLLDKHEFLSHMVELLDKPKFNHDESLLKHLLPLILHHLDSILQSQILSRSLANNVIKKLNVLNKAAESMQKEETDQEIKTERASPLQPMFTEYKDCQQHTSLVTILSGIIQAITLRCPTALIWSITKIGSIGGDPSKALILGSPLDKLPCPPSELIIGLDETEADRREAEEIVCALKEKENEIRQRSIAVGNRWICADNKDTKTTDENYFLLDKLDQMHFEAVEAKSHSEIIYEIIFKEKNLLDSCEEQVELDKPSILLLCEWATSGKRHGDHRAMICAEVIKIRNKYALELMSGEAMIGEELPVTTYPFQSVLLQFLDELAPILDLESFDVNDDEAFQQLVVLFSQLILYNVFSHDRYLCALVARNDLSPAVLQRLDVMFEDPDQTDPDDKDEKPATKEASMSISNTLGDHDYQVVDQFAMESDLMLSDGAPPLFGIVFPDNNSPSLSILDNNDDRESAHLYYVLHFPLPHVHKDSHDNNQRLVLLFGFGKRRQKFLKELKELKHELYHFFGTKEEVTEEKKDYKKYKEKLDDILKRFQALPMYERYNLSTKFLDLLENMQHASPERYGVSSEYPSDQQLSLVYQLLSLSCNIQGVIQVTKSLLVPHENVELKLVQKKVDLDVPSKLLQVVSMIRGNYLSFLMSPETTNAIFFRLLQAVHSILYPNVCASSERCTMVLLQNMYNSSPLLMQRHEACFKTACDKIESRICTSLKPSDTNLLWDQQAMKEYFEKPRSLSLDPPSLKHHLNGDRPAEVYSFVCNITLAICKTSDADRVYTLCSLCCEMASKVKNVCAELLGIINAFCCSSTSGLGYEQTVQAVNLKDKTTQQAIAFFSSILLARKVIMINDFLVEVVYPALKVTSKKNSKGIQLTCRILEQIFVVSSSSDSANKTPFTLNLYDASLLQGELSKVNLASILSVMRRLYLHVEKGEAASETHHHQQQTEERDNLFNTLFNTDDDSDLYDGASYSKSSNTSKSDKAHLLSDFVKRCLNLMSGQSWLQSRLLINDNKTTIVKAVLDQELKSHQVQNFASLLLSQSKRQPMSIEISNIQEATNRICMTLDKWSLHNASLELQLLLKMFNKEEHQHILTAIGRSIMSTLTEASDSSHRSALVGPLISKLPVPIQGRILKSASETLEKGKWWIPTGNTKMSGDSQKTLFALISSCLQNQEENKNMFLGSLQKQLQSLVTAQKEDKIDVYALQTTNGLVDAVRLRLNLVGMLFDNLLKTPSVLGEWALTLFSLLLSGIIPPLESSDVKTVLFNNVTDMVVILLQKIQVNESAQASQGQNSQLQPQAVANNEILRLSAVVRKMRKEINQRPFTEITTMCEELLPLYTGPCEIVCCEPLYSLETPHTNSKSQKADGHADQARKRTAVQFINAWELLEDSKNSGPLNLAMFGAVRVDKRPLRYIDESVRLIHHTHQKRKPLSYFLSNSLPEEDEKDNPATPSTPNGGPSTPLLQCNNNPLNNSELASQQKQKLELQRAKQMLQINAQQGNKLRPKLISPQKQMQQGLQQNQQQDIHLQQGMQPAQDQTLQQMNQSQDQQQQQMQLQSMPIASSQSNTFPHVQQQTFVQQQQNAQQAMPNMNVNQMYQVTSSVIPPPNVRLTNSSRNAMATGATQQTTDSKHALQNMLARRTGAVAAAAAAAANNQSNPLMQLQQQQLNRPQIQQQQQQQGMQAQTSMYNQQRSYIQVAPNVNISDTISGSMTLSSSQQQNMLTQQMSMQNQPQMQRRAMFNQQQQRPLLQAQQPSTDLQSLRNTLMRSQQIPNIQINTASSNLQQLQQQQQQQQLRQQQYLQQQIKNRMNAQAAANNLQRQLSGGSDTSQQFQQQAQQQGNNAMFTNFQQPSQMQIFQQFQQQQPNQQNQQFGGGQQPYQM